MARLLVAALPLALACHFDSSGLDSVGPPETSSTGPGASSTSSGSTSTTSVDPTTGSSSMTDGSTSAVDPSATTAATTTTTATTGTGSSSSTTGAPDTCGDGDLDPGEECDGEDLDQKTCEDLMLQSGVLACAADCSFDDSGCLPANWADPAFHKRRRLTIDESSAAEDLENFPVLLILSDPALLSELGPADKLRFYSEDGAKIFPHEIEISDNARIILWVTVPMISDRSGAVFYLYYDNPDAAGTADPAATWADKFIAVWHLDEVVNDEQAQGQHKDSTLDGHTGSQHGNDERMDCPIGLCQSFSSDDYIDVAKPVDFKMGDSFFTVAAWIRTTEKTDRGLFARSNPLNTEMDQTLVGLTAAGLLRVQNANISATGKTVANDGAWHHVGWVQTKDADSMKERWRLYVDGAVDFEMVVGNTNANKDTYAFRVAAGTPNSTFPSGFLGELDEVQTSTTTRSPAWMAAAFNNQKGPDMFTAIGPKEGIP